MPAVWNVACLMVSEPVYLVADAAPDSPEECRFPCFIRATMLVVPPLLLRWWLLARCGASPSDRRCVLSHDLQGPSLVRGGRGRGLQVHGGAIVIRIAGCGAVPVQRPRESLSSCHALPHCVVHLTPRGTPFSPSTSNGTHQPHCTSPVDEPPQMLRHPPYVVWST